MKKILLLVFAAFCTYASMAQNNVYGKKVVALDSVVTNAINARAGSVVEVLKALTVSGGNVTVSGGDVNITGTGALQIESVDAIDENRAANFTAATVDNINIDGNDISSSTGDITLTPTSNVDIASGDLDILGTGSLRFDGVTAINDARTGLLANLFVDNINIDGNTVQSQAGNLSLESAAEIYLNGNNVADSIAATRGYVDDQNKDAAGNDSEVQYNSSGKLAGSSVFTFSTDSLYLDAQAKFHREVEIDRSLQVSDRDLGGGNATLRIRGETASSDAELVFNSQGSDIWEILNDAGTNDDFVINKTGSVGNALSIYADSANIQLDQYGAGDFGGVAAYNLQVDANGNIIETTAGGAGGGVGGSSTQIQYNLSGTFAGSSDMTYDAVDITLNASAVSGQVILSGTDGVAAESFLFDATTMSSPNQIDIASTGASGTIDLQTGTTPTTGLTVDASQNVDIPNGDLDMGSNDILSVSDLSNTGGNLNISANTIDLQATAVGGLSLETLTVSNSQITSTSGNLNLQFPSGSDFVLTESGAETIVVDGGTNTIELGGTSGNYGTLNYGTLDVRGNVSDGGGNLTLADAVDITGNLDAQVGADIGNLNIDSNGDISDISSGEVVFNDAINSTGFIRSDNGDDEGFYSEKGTYGSFPDDGVARTLTTIAEPGVYLFYANLAFTTGSGYAMIFCGSTAGDAVSGCTRVNGRDENSTNITTSGANIQFTNNNFQANVQWRYIMLTSD